MQILESFHEPLFARGALPLPRHHAIVILAYHDLSLRYVIQESLRVERIVTTARRYIDQRRVRGVVVIRDAADDGASLAVQVAGTVLTHEVALRDKLGWRHLRPDIPLLGGGRAGHGKRLVQRWILYDECAIVHRELLEVLSFTTRSRDGSSGDAVIS